MRPHPPAIFLGKFGQNLGQFWAKLEQISLKFVSNLDKLGKIWSEIWENLGKI